MILACVTFAFLLVTVIVYVFAQARSDSDASLRKMYLNKGSSSSSMALPPVRYLFQTYHSKDKIPPDVYTNIRLYAPEYTHAVYDDNDIREFLKAHFHPRILSTFENLKVGAHKADLARYCLLYIYGGLYLDIKTELVKPVREIFTNENALYSVISYMNDHVYQGIIKAPSPRQTIFLRLIDFIVRTQNPKRYLEFCIDFYKTIQRDSGMENRTLQPGLVHGIQNTYYLFQERCSDTDASLCRDGMDWYGLCCFVWDSETPVIKTRRASYPW